MKKPAVLTNLPKIDIFFAFIFKFTRHSQFILKVLIVVVVLKVLELPAGFEFHGINRARDQIMLIYQVTRSNQSVRNAICVNQNPWYLTAHNFVTVLSTKGKFEDLDVKTNEHSLQPTQGKFGLCLKSVVNGQHVHYNASHQG